MSYSTNDFDGQIAELLTNGAVGFMPSDTIYGLSCLAFNEAAVKRLHKIKERDEHKPFIILISDVNMLDLLSIKQNEVEVAKRYWPSALTIICEAPGAKPWLNLGARTLAVRLPANDELRMLIDKTGPLVSTSANKQGTEPVKSIDEAKKTFGEEIDFYVNKGKITGEASTIVKPVDGRLRIIRRGAVKIDEKELSK